MIDFNCDGYVLYLLYGGVYFGNLFMVVVLLGVGKLMFVNVLLLKDSDICLLILYMMCKLCLGEQDGQYYYFMIVEDFCVCYVVYEFFESVEVYGNYYGMLCVWIEEQMKNGYDVLFEIDWQGVLQVKKQFCNVVGIFILLLLFDVFEECLKKCGQDELNVIM